MGLDDGTTRFVVRHDLRHARACRSLKAPAGFQGKAIGAVREWYDKQTFPEAGGILVLPTGAGKTFAAMRFLAAAPLSDGYKVLWLAHTHHLLEQAYDTLRKDALGHIAEPRNELSVRVVSGAPGHWDLPTIQATDDVVIGTIGMLQKAWGEEHEALVSFIESARGKLFVVFDEAHHAPAPTYRRFVLSLRERCEQMYLLGLTATPTHTDERKRGWLLKAFPQGIICQQTPRALMAQGVLAKPVSVEPKTDVTPDFDERQYRTWVGTNRDLPEDIIDRLAKNQKRNDYIVNWYVSHKEEYGKTLVFADRWDQCVYLREQLRTRGVRADAVYSHVDADPGSAEARNRQNRDGNARVLERFRQPNELDVLINIRMLTEGTDVPDVQTVFLTRQTTSQILMRQMVGRALRGPKFGGTEQAHIVSFVDDWKKLINWASYHKLEEGLADPKIAEYGKRPPFQLISIELVRRLARQMDTGINIAPGPYTSLLPVGWYRVEYESSAEGTDEREIVRQLVMVFENDVDGFSALIDHLLANPQDDALLKCQEPDCKLQDIEAATDEWISRFFPDDAPGEHFGASLPDDLFSVVRHVAQWEAPPEFFEFEERGNHDLDALAQKLLGRHLDPFAVQTELEGEYNRTDRYWATIYDTYDRFASQYDACVRRFLHAHSHGSDPASHRPALPDQPTEPLPAREPTEEEKEQVKRRDRHTCVCCGNNAKRQLEIDHIRPIYHGGANVLANLQTLCRTCNAAKRTQTIQFHDNHTDLTQPPGTPPQVALPSPRRAGDAEEWERFLRRWINFFYRCGAVDDTRVGKRRDAENYNLWTVSLYSGNDPKWIEPYLSDLLKRIREARSESGKTGPNSIEVSSPECETVCCSLPPEEDSPDQAQESLPFPRKLRAAGRTFVYNDDPDYGDGIWFDEEGFDIHLSNCGKAVAPDAWTREELSIVAPCPEAVAEGLKKFAVSRDLVASGRIVMTNGIAMLVELLDSEFSAGAVRAAVEKALHKRTSAKKEALVLIGTRLRAWDEPAELAAALLACMDGHQLRGLASQETGEATRGKDHAIALLVRMYLVPR